MRNSIPARARRITLAAGLMAMGGPGLWGATIGTVTVNPTTIVAGTATSVLVTAVVTDPTLVAGTVNLQQRDANGKLTAILGTLHDDGANGDVTAGDKTYSLQVTLNIATPGTIVFQVSAAFHASPVRALPAGVNGTVTGTSNPVTITITQPVNLSFVNITPTTVVGSVAGSATAVTINGLNAPVSNGQFSVSVPLREGPNIITASSTSGNTATITTTLDTTPPQLAITEPGDQFTTTDTTVTVTGIVNDIVVGTVNPTQAAVTVNGIAANVANRTFTISGVPLSLGANTIQAVGRDRVGNATTISITVNRIAPAAQQIRLVSGNNQTGSISQALATPLMVQLIGGNNAPAANVPVVFRVTQNNGLVNGNVSAVVNTDAQGKASVQWTLGARAGAGSNSVEATSAGYQGTAVFSATGNQGAPGQIVVDTGNFQTGAVSQQLPLALIAVVVDSGNNRLANVPVTFTVTQGGGNLGGQTSSTVNTDSDGRVAMFWTLGSNGGSANNQVTATFPGNQAALAVFTASGQVPGDPAGTTITGVVLDNSNLPIQGVTVRAVLSNLLTSNSSVISSLPSVQTNAQGQFTVTSAPVGFVKLLIDGSTATRPGVTFPTLDYDIVTVAGQNATVGLPIYLPALSNNTLCVTATTGGGTLTMPEAPGFSLTFSAGQVTFPGGSKTGCISATLVHPDKMPMVPGFGQQPRFLVTIQPAGAIFNPPAPISMPNVDGLPAHAVTEMYSFDHDIGAFVAIGTGTVTGDQLSVSSNPGVGVLKAGWHCGGNPASTGAAGTCPTCQTCQGSGCVPQSGSCDDGKFCTSADGRAPGPDTCVNGACQGRDIADQDTIGGALQDWDFSALSRILAGTAEALNFAPGCRATPPQFRGAIKLQGTKFCCESQTAIISGLKFSGSLGYTLPGVECFVPGLSVTLPPAPAPGIVGVGVSVGISLAGTVTGTGISSNCQGACKWQVSGDATATLSGSVRIGTILDPAYLSAALGVKGQGSLTVADACDNITVRGCIGPVILFGTITLGGFLDKSIEYTIPGSQLCTN
jgi:hypothetical protein